MRKSLIYIAFFITLCILCNFSLDYTIGKQLEKRSPYYLAFASIGVNSLECSLDCWAKIKTTSTEKELEFYLSELLKYLNLPNEADSFRLETNQNSTILHHEIISPDNEYLFLLESDTRTKETYFIISFIANEEANIKGIVEKLNRIMGIKWSHYYKYAGSLTMPLEMEGAAQLINVMEKNLDIQDLENFSGHKTCTCTGYSKRLSDFAPSMVIDGKEVNVQIAIQIDEDAGKTNIIVGSPLILGEF
ncbi:MAG TPA: YwmB family TATA-box binding protein [Syntrophomonadaceae bacterium]|nr:YwmB family TATA-box binding protein [Syntrophomonadaceae bacterium]